ncbi:sister chromatid cohesion 1 protein 4-like isoform X4 [Durio zibethinus]|uniref:Sister chromatid cohesion 1 protein 4-like isoform X4 n=1 Tax=Durio zibethinus TaxID=66656 RepID=A0A6P5YWW4_DURZI|nr:sister chromatid cohesion 1 protein 4-like isoform X4 [Durio zibethinus]
MFYSQFILAKKGPLGTIWIAAHLERKLRKNQVADTDIGVSVDSILFPEVPIALRLSSHLLLGVVRIYSRKVNYLFDDCSEALLKIKQAFRSTAVDLPPEESTAPYHSITLPETFDLDDFELPDNEIFQGNYVDHHISSREQITLQDTMDGVVYSTSQFGLDERFGDGETSQIGLLDEELVLERIAVPGHDGVSKYDLQGSDLPQKQNPSNLEAVPVDCSGDQVDAIAANSEFVKFDQELVVPRLAEVPNLSCVHEALAGSDHVEPEHHNLKELDNSEYTSAVAIIRGPDGLDRVEDMHNGVMHSMDRTDGECAESPSCSNITFDLDDPSRRTCSSSTCVPTSDGYLENDQLSHKSEIGNYADTTDNLDESSSPAKAVASNPSCPLVSPSRITVIDGEAQACQEPNDSENLKKPIIHEDVSSVLVLESDNLAAAEHNLVELSIREEVHACGASIEVQGEACQTRMSEPGLCDDQLENSNICAMSDLPAPEKLLSVPEGPLDKPSDILGESTSDKEVLTGNDEIDAGTKLISGKKRSITESTLTIESINSVESFGRPQSRTAESVPDDDDLLSSILGMSGDLACLHSEPYDLSCIRISEGDENHASSEVAKDSECSVRPNIAKEGRIEGSSMPVIHGNDEQAQSAGTPIQTDTQQGEYNDLSIQLDRYAIDGVPQLLQHELLDGITEMEIDRDNVEVANVANHSVLDKFGVLSHTNLVTGDTSNMTAGEITNSIDGSMLNNATCFPLDQKMTTQPGEDASELDMRNDKGTNPTGVLESIIAAETESKATDKFLSQESKASTSVEVSIADYCAPIENGTNILATIQTGESVNGAQNAYETGYDKVGVEDEAQVEGALLDLDEKDPLCKGSEECKMDSTYSEKVDIVLKNASLNDGETPTFQEVDAVNEEMTSLVDNQAEFEDVGVANDKEFLNLDDDELGEDDDDGMPCDESRLLENSGWSSRTRAVAKYLQSLFEDEAVHGRKLLSMDSLLAHKTRKEASRMFFETLVLKTRDYIHVEQGKPFDNICIQPRTKLMKSDF